MIECLIGICESRGVNIQLLQLKTILLHLEKYENKY